MVGGATRYPTKDQPGIEIIEPRGICYSPYRNAQGVYAGGVFIAHRDKLGAGMVSHLQFFNQILHKSTS